jgi:hypothetical protein
MTRLEDPMPKNGYFKKLVRTRKGKTAELRDREDAAAGWGARRRTKPAQSILPAARRDAANRQQTRDLPGEDRSARHLTRHLVTGLGAGRDDARPTPRVSIRRTAPRLACGQLLTAAPTSEQPASLARRPRPAPLPSALA